MFRIGAKCLREIEPEFELSDRRTHPPLSHSPGISGNIVALRSPSAASSMRSARGLVGVGMRGPSAGGDGNYERINVSRPRADKLALRPIHADDERDERRAAKRETSRAVTRVKGGRDAENVSTCSINCGRPFGVASAGFLQVA
jgi:hypothetical protein